MTDVCVSSATVVSSTPVASSTPTEPSEESCYINLLESWNREILQINLYKMYQIKVQKINREIFWVKA